ncbi:MAG TPA: hypothetical protein GX405_12600, partial [Rhizobiales bacterium]|nr:hypothetical protein [Hyphomicrobiales bacterium]
MNEQGDDGAWTMARVQERLVENRWTLAAAAVAVAVVAVVPDPGWLVPLAAVLAVAAVAVAAPRRTVVG